jgi:fatty-acid desaturase
MTEFLNHAITVGDVLMVWGMALAIVLAVVAYAIISINMGWHR